MDSSDDKKFHDKMDPLSDKRDRTKKHLKDIRPLTLEEEYLVRRKDLELEFKIRERLLDEEMLKKTTELAKASKKKVQSTDFHNTNGKREDYLSRKSLDAIAKLRSIMKSKDNAENSLREPDFMKQSREISPVTQTPGTSTEKKKRKRVIRKKKAKSDSGMKLSQNVVQSRLLNASTNTGPDITSRFGNDFDLEGISKRDKFKKQYRHSLSKGGRMSRSDEQKKRTRPRKTKYQIE